MPAKVLVTTSDLAAEALALLRSRGFEVSSVPLTTTAGELLDLVKREKFDGIISRTVQITAEVLDALPGLRVISKHGAGVDNIDIEAATRLGIPVLATPGANAQSVVEHTFTLMLALAKRLLPLDASLRQGRWDKSGFICVELYEKTLGIIGFGRIGSRVGALAGAFGMSVLTYDPYIPDSAIPGEIRRVETLDDLLAGSDVVSLHCPLTEETRLMIGRGQLRRMKPTAVLINTARGPIVDASALADSLAEGTIGGAGIDCHATEPAPADCRLWAFPNVVATPHTAAATDGALRRVAVQAARQLIALLDGEPIDPDTIVNPSVLSADATAR